MREKSEMFWLVVSLDEGLQAYTSPCFDKQTAIDQTKRLVIENPCKTFFVLESCGYTTSKIELQFVTFDSHEKGGK
jgi:hypothetical protein